MELLFDVNPEDSPKEDKKSRPMDGSHALIQLYFDLFDSPAPDFLFPDPDFFCNWYLCSCSCWLTCLLSFFFLFGLSAIKRV